MKNNKYNEEKVLLALLPFWDPLIPPVGIAYLKGFIQDYGYHVKTVDANIDISLREGYDKYFETLEEFVPENRRGNIYNIGQKVFQNHMMAHLNYTDEKEYIKLVKVLVFKTFFCAVDDRQVLALNEILQGFYTTFENYFLDLLDKERPTVLGLTVYDGTLPASLLALKLAKKKNPHIRTVIGGGIFANQLEVNSPNFDIFLEKTKHYIDKIVVGEGEMLFLKLLQGKLPDSQRVFTLADTNRETLDLATLDIPDYSDFHLEHYPLLATVGSRSCPFQCNFCAETTYWGKFRKKNPAQIVKELNLLYEKHGRQLFLMSDSLLNPIITDLSREFLKSGQSIYWDGFLRADKSVCDTKNTMVWRRGGFYRARLGLESGSERVLKLMDKKITPNQIKSALSSLAHAGIKTTTYWLIGYPGETEEDFQQTLELIRELKNDIYEADCNPFNYFVTGQVKSGEWKGKNKCALLFPEDTKNILMTQTWIMNQPPSREEIFNRVNRFVQHCEELGLLNPYSLYDINKADERWQKLHKNAVPPLIRFEEKEYYIDENKHVKELVSAKNLSRDDGDFGF